MHFAVTGGAIGVGGILDLDEVRFELAICIEGFRFPGPCTGGAIIAGNSKADQSRGICIAKPSALENAIAEAVSGLSRWHRKQFISMVPDVFQSQSSVFPFLFRIVVSTFFVSIGRDSSASPSRDVVAGPPPTHACRSA